MKHVENSLVNQSKRFGFFFNFLSGGPNATLLCNILCFYLTRPESVFFFLHRGKTEQSDLFISVYAFNEQPGKVVLLISWPLKRKQISFGINAGL